MRKQGRRRGGKRKPPLAVALPDRVCLPFAEHADALLPLLEGLKQEYDCERMDADGLLPVVDSGGCGGQSPSVGFMEECLAVSRRWIAGAAKLRVTPPREESALLTGRELEVARLVVARLSNKEIAERLHITERTVKAHLTSVYEKSGGRNRSGFRKIFIHYLSDNNI